MTVTFTGANSNLFRVLADRTTITSLRLAIMIDCNSALASRDMPMAPYDSNSNSSLPRPEQVVQYYRASTVALSLDGYNNTATYTEDVSVADTPLPSTVDNALLTCINSTIGAKVPLVDWSAESHGISNSAVAQRLDAGALVGISWLILTIFSMLS